MKIKTKLWIVLWGLLALMVFVVFSIFFTAWKDKKERVPDIALSRNYPVESYQKAHLAYRQDKGLWAYQTGKNMIRETTPYSQQRLEDDELPLVVSAVESKGVFVGANMWRRFFQFGKNRDDRELIARLLKKGSYFNRFVNSYGGDFGGEEEVAFKRLFPSPLSIE